MIGAISWFLVVAYGFYLILKPTKADNIATQLTKISQREKDPMKKVAYLRAASYLRDEAPETAATDDQDQVGSNEAWQESGRSTQEKVEIAPKSIADQFKQLENINTLLYIGAFLIVVSASVFVGFNYHTLSGNFKTIFLASFAVVFYLSGMLLYLKSTKIKEAGLTFLTIGLILFPLVGLAYFKYLSPDHGKMIWFATSALTILLYTISLKLVKKSHLAYFVSFVSLSLFESTVSLFSAPIYYFAWGMSFSSILFIVTSKINFKDKMLSDSFLMSANIFLPISILFAAFFTLGDNWFVLAINILLAGVFYFLSNLLSVKNGTKEGFLTAALLLFPLGSLLLCYDRQTSFDSMAYILGGIGLIYILFYELIRNRLTDLRPKLTLLIGGIVPIFVCCFFVHDMKSLLLTLLYILLINVYSFYRAKMLVNLALIVSAIIVIPEIFLQYVDNHTAATKSLVYLLLTVGLFGFSFLVSKWPRNFVDTIILSYRISLLVSVLVVFNSPNHLFAACLLLANMLVVYALSYLEARGNEANYEVATVIFFYAAAIMFGKYLDLAYLNYVWVFMISGLILFALGMLLKRRSNILSYCGIVGPFVGAAYSVAEHSWLPILSLTIGGAISLIKSFEEKNEIAKYVSAGVFIVALNWLLEYRNIHEAQYFTLPWVAFFGVIAYLRNKKGDRGGQDLMVAFALGFLTISTFIQSIASHNGLIYGLILGIESIALIIVGIATNYKLLLRWGIIALIIDVLYQSISIAGAPKWIIIGAVGLVFIIGATYALAKSSRED